MPASFGPASFFLRTSSLSKDSNIVPDICCPGTSCSKIKRQFGRCYCSTLEFPSIDDKEFSVTTSCTDPAGQCGTTIPVTEQCIYPGIDLKRFRWNGMRPVLLAYATFRGNWNWAEAEKEFKQAIDLKLQLRFDASMV